MADLGPRAWAALGCAAAVIAASAAAGGPVPSTAAGDAPAPTAPAGPAAPSGEATMSGRMAADAPMTSAPSSPELAAAEGEMCSRLPEAFGVRQRMVGAFSQRAEHALWPSFAAIRHYDARPGVGIITYFCGASVIAPEWALTAAHCVEGAAAGPGGWALPEAGPIEVVVGLDDLADESEADIYTVRDILRPPGFEWRSSPDGPTPLNDLALLRLDHPHPGPFMRVSLARGSDPTADARGFAAGFGLTDDTLARMRAGAFPLDIFPATLRDGRAREVAAGSRYLLHAMLPVIDEAACAADYPEHDPRFQVCAGYARGREDSCQGDSGGPLVALDADGCPYQIGVVSYGRGCGTPEGRGVYARVSAQSDWIEAHAGPLPNAGAPPIAPETSADAVNAAVETILGDLGPAVGRAELRIVSDFSASTPGEEHVSMLGDIIELEVTSASPGRLLVIDVRANGEVVQIFPNGCSPHDLWLVAGETARAPGAFRASPPLGPGRVIAIVLPDDFPIDTTVRASQRIDSCDAFGAEELPTAYALNLLREVREALMQRGAEGQNAAGFAAGVAPYRIVQP